MMMSREEECTTDEEIGLLRSGKRFRPNRKRIVVDREKQHNEFEDRYIGKLDSHSN
jgi:hypothetical protein